MKRANSTNSCNYLENDNNRFKRNKTDNIFDEGFNYFEVPSLQSIAIVKIVVELWKQPDVMKVMQDEKVFMDPKTNEISEELVEVISKKLNLLPPVLKDKASNMIKPIGCQMLEWIHRNERICTSYKYRDTIYWTMEGIIDQKKTLETLQKKEIVKDINILYDEACIYCAEDFIASLWECLSIRQKSFKDSVFYNTKIPGSYKYLVAYWTCFVKNDFSELWKLGDHYDIYASNQSVSVNMFMLSMSQSNALAAKYFWNKLTDEERNNNVIRWTKYALREIYEVYMEYTERDVMHSGRWLSYTYHETNERTNILCLLLSQIKDKGQQREIFLEYIFVIGRALFYDWRYQKLILPIMQLIWDFLPSELYVRFLATVLLKETTEGKSVKILTELWCNSPIHLKRCFIRHIKNSGRYAYLLCDYLETIKLILNDATVEERTQIIFDVIEYSKEFYLGDHHDKLSALEELILRDIILVKSVNDSFKKYLVRKHGVYLCQSWICDNKWQSLEKFLDWGFTSQEQIDEFKKGIPDKHGMYRCLEGKGNCENVDKFMKFFFSSDEEINDFKNEFMRVEEEKRRLRERYVEFERLFCSRDVLSLMQNLI